MIGQYISRSSGCLALVWLSVYSYHRLQLSEFVAKEQAKGQQNYLQNALDNQDDGIIIFAQAPVAPASADINQVVVESEVAGNRSFTSLGHSSRNDQSMHSFVNEEDHPLEVLFHNESLVKILGIESNASLEAIASQPIFLGAKWACV